MSDMVNVAVIGRAQRLIEQRSRRNAKWHLGATRYRRQPEPQKSKGRRGRVMRI
jgi:hypothetical protein